MRTGKASFWEVLSGVNSGLGIAAAWVIPGYFGFWFAWDDYLRGVAKGPVEILFRIPAFVNPEIRWGYIAFAIVCSSLIIYVNYVMRDFGNVKRVSAAYVLIVFSVMLAIYAWISRLPNTLPALYEASVRMKALVIPDLVGSAFYMLLALALLCLQVAKSGQAQETNPSTQ